MNSYQESLDFLYSLISYEKDQNWTYDNKTLNLERFKKFLKQLRNPESGIRPIHVAGSDGKGSTCAMISGVLQSMGYRVGLFTSPHMHTIRERIQINRDWIAKDAFARWTEYLRKQIEDGPQLKVGFATFFELLTAMAFLYFRDEKVDFSVIETGLGGRLDATNVMQPRVAVITHISLEHTDKLGNTLEEIAEEKLGIRRENAPLIVGHQDACLLPYFRERLKNHPSPVVFTDDRYRLLEARIEDNGRIIRYENPGGEARVIHIPLLGRCQAENALTAVAALDALAGQGDIPEPGAEELDRGMRNTSWPGRFEVIRREGSPLVVLDVAHTAKGALALRQSLDEAYPDRGRTFVLGFLRDKRVREMIEALARPGDRMIFTRAPTPRGLTLEEIRMVAASLPVSNAEFVENPGMAFGMAMNETAPGDAVIVAGSLYLVGELRGVCVEVAAG